MAYGRRVGWGSVGDEDVRCEARLCLGFHQHPSRRVLIPPLSQLHGNDVPAVVFYDLDVGLPTPQPDMELVNMPYLRVLQPVSALEHLEGAAEPAQPEEDYSRRDWVTEAGHEVGDLPAGEAVVEPETKSEDHPLRRVLHASEECSTPLVELPATLLAPVPLNSTPGAVLDDL